MLFVVVYIYILLLSPPADVVNIYTREAGPGNLQLSVEGPGKAVISLEPRPNGFLGAMYKVPKPGGSPSHPYPAMI